MQTGTVMLAVAAVLTASAMGRDIDAILMLDYDCSGKPDGNYPHPTLCTHYVACVGEVEAYDMECSIGPNNTVLHFNKAIRTPSEDLCVLPELACCGCHDPTTTTSATTIIPTTTTSTTTIPTTTTPTTTTPTTTTTTTTTLTTTMSTTTTSITTTTRPPTPPGDECDPTECKLKGYCNCYEDCVSNGDGSNLGHIVRRNCGEDLFWQPNNLTGGTCVYFANLDEPTKASYKEDITCIPKCEWFQEHQDECSPRYKYRVPFDDDTNLGREEDLSCPEPPPGKPALYWSQPKLTCVPCGDAVKLDGKTPCTC